MTVLSVNKINRAVDFVIQYEFLAKDCKRIGKLVEPDVENRLPYECYVYSVKSLFKYINMNIKDKKFKQIIPPETITEIETFAKELLNTIQSTEINLSAVQNELHTTVRVLKKT